MEGRPYAMWGKGLKGQQMPFSRSGGSPARQNTKGEIKPFHCCSGHDDINFPLTSLNPYVLSWLRHCPALLKVPSNVKYHTSHLFPSSHEVKLGFKCFRCSVVFLSLPFCPTCLEAGILDSLIRDQNQLFADSFLQVLTTAQRPHF